VLSDTYVPTFQGKFVDNNGGIRSVHIYQTVRHHRPENDHIHNHKTYLETTRFLRWFFQLTPQSSVLRD